MIFIIKMNDSLAILIKIYIKKKEVINFDFSQIKKMKNPKNGDPLGAAYVPSSPNDQRRP